MPSLNQARDQIIFAIHFKLAEKKEKNANLKNFQFDNTSYSPTLFLYYLSQLMRQKIYNFYGPETVSKTLPSLFVPSQKYYIRNDKPKLSPLFKIAIADLFTKTKMNKKQNHHWHRKQTKNKVGRKTRQLSC